MFGWIDKPSWNPVVGCKHGCKYCWARSLATTRLRRYKKYKNGFKYHLDKKEINRKFKRKNVFVSAMGDLFGDWVSSKWIKRVLKTIGKSPNTNFLLLTKNPKRFTEFKNFPDNVILGTTIETNRKYDVTSAHTTHPPQSRHRRYMVMKTLQWDHKFVAMEPLMDFDLNIFEKWIQNINPEKVSISFDNYNHGIISPNKEKAIKLCKDLASFTEVLPHGNWITDISVKKQLQS